MADQICAALGDRPRSTAGAVTIINELLQHRKGPIPSVGISVLHPPSHWVLHGTVVNKVPTEHDYELRFEQGAHRTVATCEINAYFVNQTAFLEVFNQMQAYIEHGDHDKALQMVWDAYSVWAGAPSVQRPWVVNGSAGLLVLLYQILVRKESFGPARTRRFCCDMYDPDEYLYTLRLGTSLTVIGGCTFGLWTWLGAYMAGANGLKFFYAPLPLLALADQDGEDVEECDRKPVASGRGEDFL